MHVQLTTGRVDEFGVAHRDGDVCDIPAAEARRLIEAGQATPAEDPASSPPAPSWGEVGASDFMRSPADARETAVARPRTFQRKNPR